MTIHRYRVDVSPDGPNHYVLRVPELDGTNGAGEVTGQCANLDDLEYDAESLVAATLDSCPDAIQVDIRWDTSPGSCRNSIPTATSTTGERSKNTN